MHTDWVNQAFKRHKDLDIPLPTLLGSFDEVCDAVGECWLQEQNDRLQLAHISVSNIPPLYRNLSSPADTCLVEVCELAAYLKHFLQDPALVPMIKDLQSAKYESTSHELALAYRWSKAGSDVQLRPSVPKGEADFLARIEDLPFTVEVSGFPSDIFRTIEWRIPLIVEDAIKSVFGEDHAIAVKLRFSGLPDGNAEQMIRQAVVDACQRLQHEDDKQSIGFETAFAKIEIEHINELTEGNPMTRDKYKRVVDRLPHDWTSFVRVTRNRKPEGRLQIEAMYDPTAVEVARIFLQMPPAEGDKTERLRKKFKKESSQLHGIAGPRIVILDISGSESDIHSMNRGSRYTLSGFSTRNRRHIAIAITCKPIPA